MWLHYVGAVPDARHYFSAAGAESWWLSRAATLSRPGPPRASVFLPWSCVILPFPCTHTRGHAHVAIHGIREGTKTFSNLLLYRLASLFCTVVFSWNSKIDRWSILKWRDRFPCIGDLCTAEIEMRGEKTQRGRRRRRRRGFPKVAGKRRIFQSDDPRLFSERFAESFEDGVIVRLGVHPISSRAIRKFLQYRCSRYGKY